MSVDNFKWYLHVLLFVHAMVVRRRTQGSVDLTGAEDGEEMELGDTEAFGDVA
jgi:hypothetical protein